MGLLMSFSVCLSGPLASAVHFEALSPGTITLHVLSGRLCPVVPVLDNAAVDDKPLVGGREPPPGSGGSGAQGPSLFSVEAAPSLGLRAAGGPPMRSLRPGTAPGWGAFPLFLSPLGPWPWQQATTQPPPGLRLQTGVQVHPWRRDQGRDEKG